MLAKNEVTTLDGLRANRARDGWGRWAWTSGAYTEHRTGWTVATGPTARSVRRAHGLSPRQFRRRSKALRRGTTATLAILNRILRRNR